MYFVTWRDIQFFFFAAGGRNGTCALKSNSLLRCENVLCDLEGFIIFCFLCSRWQERNMRAPKSSSPLRYERVLCDIEGFVIYIHTYIFAAGGKNRTCAQKRSGPLRYENVFCDTEGCWFFFFAAGGRNRTRAQEISGASRY